MCAKVALKKGGRRIFPIQQSVIIVCITLQNQSAPSQMTIHNTKPITLPRCDWLCHKVRAHANMLEMITFLSVSQVMKPSSISQTPWVYFFDWIRTFPRCTSHFALVHLCTSLLSMPYLRDADFLPRNRHAHATPHDELALVQNGIDIQRFFQPFMSLWRMLHEKEKLPILYNVQWC
jgi:hypothetical protein